jgi:RHS repeat-associated protein
VQFDANGTIEATYQSLPFGDGYNAIPAPGSPTAEDPTEHHFTAKERDSESGNDYFGARYYASNTGRWLSPDWSSTPDPIPYADIGDPQSLNLYGYVGNNPVTYGDADGHVYQVCDKNGQNCSNMSDPAFEGEESSDKKAGEHFQNGEIFHMENGQKVLDGKFKWLGPDVPGDAAGNQFGANIIGNGGMAAVKFFLTNMVLSATGDAAIGGIKLGAEALMAARAAKAADAAAEATSQSWSLGAFKSSTKWANQLLKRGWTSSEISDTIANGERFPATNNVNPANTATRYVSPSTGKSVVVDDVTQEVIHVGGSGFNY